MTHCYGLKRRTRYKFQKGFRNAGSIRMHKNLTNYKVGDIVDVVVDGSIHRGMPHKFYHGRTGRVFNVNPRAVGVEINKQVRNRLIKKRLHIRVEHLRLSTSRKEFLDRIRANDKVYFSPNFSSKLKPTKTGKESPQRDKLLNLTAKLKSKSLTWFSLTPSFTSKSSDSI